MKADLLNPIDQVSIVGLAAQIQASTRTSNISTLASRFGIPLMSEHRNRSTIIARLQYKPDTQREDNLAATQSELKTAREMIETLLAKSQGANFNSSRKSYAPWLKQYLARLLADGTPYKTIASLSGISEETLRHFRADHLVELAPEVSSDDHQFIKDAWHSAPARCRKTLDRFWAYLGHRHSDYRISFEQVRQILVGLGLRYPRGKKSKDSGTNVKQPFVPNALWEGDGKQINITVNGIKGSFCWYAFCDQHTSIGIFYGYCPQ